MSNEVKCPAVPDFTVTGFEGGSSDRLAATHAQLKNVQALRMSVCVGASYNSSTNEVCFEIPIYGQFCIPSPVKIPVDAELKVCAETCGSIIPTGLKATLYVNGSAVTTVVLVGFC